MHLLLGLTYGNKGPWVKIGQYGPIRANRNTASPITRQSPGNSLADPICIGHRAKRKVAQPLNRPLSKFSVEHMPHVGFDRHLFSGTLKLRVRAGRWHG
jgi:hypothetical protein